MTIIIDGFMVGTGPGLDKGSSEAAKMLRGQLPTSAGVYVHLIRPPGASRWIAAYVGEGANLRNRIKSYINSNGTFGEITAPAKCW